MPDNLIIAPDGLVKVEPAPLHVLRTGGGVLKTRRVAYVLRLGVRRRRKGGTGTARRKRAHGFDVDTDGASVIH